MALAEFATIRRPAGKNDQFGGVARRFLNPPKNGWKCRYFSVLGEAVPVGDDLAKYTVSPMTPKSSVEATIPAPTSHAHGLSNVTFNMIDSHSTATWTGKAQRWLRPFAV